MQEILKWLAALGTGGLTAGLVAVVGLIGSGPAGVAPWLAGLIALVSGKLVSWLVAKIPAA